MVKNYNGELFSRSFLDCGLNVTGRNSDVSIRSTISEWDRGLVNDVSA